MGNGDSLSVGEIYENYGGRGRRQCSVQAGSLMEGGGKCIEARGSSKKEDACVRQGLR